MWRHGPAARSPPPIASPTAPPGAGTSSSRPPSRCWRQELGIPVFQPLNFKDEADRAALAGLRPDALVVAAYGLILPQSVLDIPTIGPFNVHGSLLPQYRGAAPIQRAIMDGNHLTGITIMRMERGLDTGPMLLQRALGIGIDDTAATMHDELADLGGRLMVEVLPAVRRRRSLHAHPAGRGAGDLRRQADQGRRAH